MTPAALIALTGSSDGLFLSGVVIG